MFETNPKLEDKPKTRKQKIVRDKIHLLQKVGKKLYAGDKINKIKHSSVKLYTEIILKIRLVTNV